MGKVSPNFGWAGHYANIGPSIYLTFLACSSDGVGSLFGFYDVPWQQIEHLLPASGIITSIVPWSPTCINKLSFILVCNSYICDIGPSLLATLTQREILTWRRPMCSCVFNPFLPRVPKWGQ